MSGLSEKIYRVSSLSEKMYRLEAMCPGCKFVVIGNGDEAAIQIISEFGSSFIVKKEWTELDGAWPECWFNYEITKRLPKPKERSYAIDPIKLAAKLGIEPKERDILLIGSKHYYHCRCDVCREWWKMMGPDPDTGECGGFTMEELGLDPADYPELKE